MKKVLFAGLLALTAVGMAPASLRAQLAPSGFKLFLSRYELGYTLPFTWARYTRTDRFTVEGQTIDTSISMNVRSKSSIGATAGWYFPVKQLGQKSKLCIDVAFLYNLYTFDYPTSALRLQDDSLYYDFSSPISAATLHVGLPIGVSTRIGHDAMADKGIRWCWNAGIGVLPSINLTADVDNADASIGVQPYIKSEVGVFGGISWKLRLMYSFLDLTYIDVDASNSLFSDGKTGTKLIGKGNLNVSLVVMPFSFLWSKKGWYNSYGGSEHNRVPRAPRVPTRMRRY